MPSNLRIDKLTRRFLDKLNTCHEVSTLECLLDSVEEKYLVAVLESVKCNAGDNANKLNSRNLVGLILYTLKWEKLMREPQLLVNVRNMVEVIGLFSPPAIGTLITMGIGCFLAEIMKKEVDIDQNIVACTETNEQVRTCHVVSLLLPAIQKRYYTQDVNNISNNVLSEGLKITRTEAHKFLKDTFPTLYNICQLPKCPTDNKVVLLKMICLAINMSCLEEMIPIEEILIFLRKLMTNNPISVDNILIGFAILIELRHLVDSTEEKLFMDVLESVESIIRFCPDKAYKMIPYRLLFDIFSTLKWEKLVREPQLLLNVMDVIDSCNSLKISTLIRMGIGCVLIEIMKKEVENQQNIVACNETDEQVRVCHVISLLLPAIENRYYTQDIDKISSKILSEGSFIFTITWSETTRLLKETFHTLYNICQLPECPIDNQVLLLKMICLAINMSYLEELIPLDELLSFMRKLMTDNPISDDKNLIGFAILIELSHLGDLIKDKLLVAVDESVENIMRSYLDNAYKLIPYRLLFDIFSNLKWKKLARNPQLLLNVRNVINGCDSLQISTLIRMGIGCVLVEIMKKEVENQQKIVACTETYEQIRICHVISLFLPPIRGRYYTNDINTISSNILSGGFRTTWTEATRLLKETFHTLYNICQLPECQNDNLVLLLKMICLAIEMKCLEDLIPINELLNFVRKFMNDDKMLIGFAILIELRQVLNSSEERLLVLVVESYKRITRSYPDDPYSLISYRLLFDIFSTLKWEKLVRKPQLLRKVRNEVNRCNSLDDYTLISMGIGCVLVEIMKKEVENQQNIIACSETGEHVTTFHVFSLFLPNTRKRYYTQDINKISSKILTEGFEITLTDDTRLLKETFHTLYNICQLPECPIDNHVLLVKMICWANDMYCLEELIPIDELLSLVRKLMTGIPTTDDKILVGFAILIELGYSPDFFKTFGVAQFLKSMRPIATELMSKGQFEWIWLTYDYMIPQWLNEETISKFRTNDECLATKIGDIDTLLRDIVSDTLEENHGAMDDNYCRLKSKLKIILNLPDFSSHKGKLSVSSEWIEKFRALVTFVVSTVDAILVNNDFINIYPDLPDLDKNTHVPNRPMDIRLGLNKSSSFDRVLGPSKSKEKLFSNPLLRTLRLLSILYEVNENWGILFGYLSTDKLVDRSCYISNVLQEAMKHLRTRKNCGEYLLDSFVGRLTYSYPFLLSVENRTFLCKSIINARCNPISTCQFTTFRRRTLNSIVDQLSKLEDRGNSIWTFRFSGEIGHGIGPTKEFYSEFSKDCKSYEYDLWHGEPNKSRDGILYVNSPLGLFPTPKPSRNASSMQCLSAIGMVMAKSITDGHRMDINFSNAFYKCLFRKNLDAQHLSLADFKYVMPSIYNFIESLVDALREKWSVESNETLSVEEKVRAMSKIECDGCSFEGLCVNFTLPGYPDVEMEEGGSEVLLSIDNLEKYLKLLTWWLLYKNPQNSIKEVCDGFRNVLNPRFVHIFYPHEYDEVFCGLNKEQWTVEYLKNNSVLDEFDPEAPVVQYLFEVLSSLSAINQRSFLQFTTSTPRLPVGGLAALEPKLTVKRKSYDGNPNDYLPSAMTCFNTLFITEYSTKEALEEKLLLAITEGTNSFQYR